MYRWHVALSGDAILGAKAKEKMYTPWVDEGGGSHYGYGWSIESTPHGKLITHNGGNPFFFSDFLRYVEGDVVVYYSTNSRDRSMRRLARRMAEVVFTGSLPAAPPAPVASAAPPAPPAPVGSPAARWRLPGTPAAALAAELLDAIAAGDDAARRAAIPRLFSPALVERRGIDAVLAMLVRLHGDFGRFEVASFEAGGGEGPLEAKMTLRSEAMPDPIAFTLAIEPAGEPGGARIASLGVEVGN
jgi:hypothetical protein